MGRFIQVKATIDGEERVSVAPESALPHMPQWTAVDADEVRAHPWDFDPNVEDSVPDLGPEIEPDDDPDDEPPAGNASAAEWRAYATAHGVTDADQYSRDELRDHVLNNQPLPSEES